MFSNPFTLAISATKYCSVMITVIVQEFMNVSKKELSTPRTDNRYLLPLLFTLITTKLIYADFAAHRTIIPIIVNLSDKMFCGQSIFLEYLKNPLSRNTHKPGYF